MTRPCLTERLLMGRKESNQTNKQNRKMLVRIANREDLIRLLLQKQSDLGLSCLSMPFWQATSVHNFRAFITIFFSVLVAMPLEDVSVSFLPLASLLDLPKKGKYQKLFHIIYFSNR